MYHRRHRMDLYFSEANVLSLHKTRAFYNYFDRNNDLPDFNEIDANSLKRIDDLCDHCNFYTRYYIRSEFEQTMISRIQNNMNRLADKYSDRFLKKSDLEKTLTSLPVDLNGIIHGYYYDQTIIVIDWIKMYDTLAANFDNMQGTLSISERLRPILNPYVLL